MTSHSRLIAAADVTSEKVLGFHRYWESKSVAGAAPLRASIDPTEIPRLLPHLVIAAIETPPMRIRYRLVGTRLVEANGWDYTNRYLDECNFAVEPLLVECYRQLITTRAPVYAYYEWTKTDWVSPRGAVGASESGFFPLSSDGTAIDFAISVADNDIGPRPRAI